MHYIECILIQIGFEIRFEGNMMQIQIGSNRNQIETSKFKTLNRSRIIDIYIYIYIYRKIEGIRMMTILKDGICFMLNHVDISTFSTLVDYAELCTTDLTVQNSK